MINFRTAQACALAVLAALFAGCGERPPIDTVQRGYRGTGMDQVYNPRLVASTSSINTLPADAPQVPPGGPQAKTVFKNVQVLGELGVGEFTRLMVSMTAWVSPQQGCTYCHTANFAEDTLYTKVVSRRMLQMTKHINTDWKTHVAQTGVTCYTCHRGQPVPANIWFNGPSGVVNAYAGNKAGQNMPANASGLASLPYDPFTPFLSQANEARVVGKTALPVVNRNSIKQTEWTYGLMMHMSESLGVNCTYCHNSRSFAEWDTSTPQRSVAWYGIRLARDLNNAYLDPLKVNFPANRLGPAGDVPKVNCATCHQGAFKPLYGAQHLANHPELTKVTYTGGTGAAAAANAEIGPGGLSSSAATPVAPGAGTAIAPAPATSPAAATSGAGAASGAVAAGSTIVFFPVGSPALPSDGTRSLAGVIDALKADPKAHASVSGYHSAAGDAAQNEELAKQRAMAVRDAITAAGVTPDRIDLEKPQSTGANVAGEDPTARRVEVIIRQQP